MKLFIKYLFLSLLLCLIGDLSCWAAPNKPVPPKRRLVKILAIDGGGVRGVIPATILAYLEKNLKKKKHLVECFDIIAGTSTGGLIALMLSAPDGNGTPRYTAEDVQRIYSTLGSRIFDQPFSHLLGSLNGWIDEKYPAQNLEDVLKEYLGDVHLRELLTYVVVPAYEIVHNKLVYFTTHGARETPFADFYAWEAARATSAAPTFFAPAQIRNAAEQKTYTFVDGAIAAQNPTFDALIHALKLFGKDNDFLIVSLGTGVNFGDPEIEFGGKLEWIEKIVPLLIGASEETVSSQVEKLFAGDPSREYYRFQVTLLDSMKVELDDARPENIKMLQGIGEWLIQRHRLNLDRIIEILDNS